MCGQNYPPWPVRNSLSSLVHTYLNIGPSLPTFTSRPLTWWMNPGLSFFLLFSASVHYTECKLKNKKWKRPDEAMKKISLICCLLLMLRTHNSTHIDNKLVIFSGMGEYYSDTYIVARPSPLLNESSLISNLRSRPTIENIKHTPPFLQWSRRGCFSLESTVYAHLFMPQ